MRLPTPKLVGARELKTRLGTYLRAVRNGSTITITERGEPIARLSPLRAKEVGIDAVLTALEEEGVLSKGSGEPFDERPAVRTKGEPIERTISRDRDDRL